MPSSCSARGLPSSSSSPTARSRPERHLVCASEGNHGRGVAHTATAGGLPGPRLPVGNACADARADAIAGEGAEVVRVGGTYDDAVRARGGGCARARLDGDLRHLLARLRAQFPRPDHARLHAADGRSRRGPGRRLAARRYFRSGRRRRPPGRGGRLERTVTGRFCPRVDRGRAGLGGVPAGIGASRRADGACQARFRHDDGRASMR